MSLLCINCSLFTISIKPSHKAVSKLENWHPMIHVYQNKEVLVYRTVFCSASIPTSLLPTQEFCGYGLQKLKCFSFLIMIIWLETSALITFRKCLFNSVKELLKGWHRSATEKMWLLECSLKAEVHIALLLLFCCFDAT